jgi:protoporphyrinogen/coproporphyrinogen III oxidase
MHLQDKPSIAIIGGGITGLSAAWYLQHNNDVNYTVIEANDRWGGKIITETVDGPGARPFLVEGGPDTFVTRKAGVRDLAVGLDLNMISTSTKTSDMYVLDKGKPIRIPMGPGAFITSPLMSFGGKLRLLAEPFARARKDAGDESIAEFTERRLGKEALDKFIGPVLGGIYNADPAVQSILVTSPIMREMEHDHGSLAIAAIAKMRQARKQQKAQPADTPKLPRFVTFEGGAQEMIDTLVDNLSGDLRLGCAVENIVAVGDGYELVLSDGSMVYADIVVLAIPANVGAQLLTDIAPDAATAMQAIKHTNLGTISLMYKTEDLDGVERIQGLMIPRREQRQIDAVAWTSHKNDRVAPEGYEMLRVFFGGSAPDVATLPEAELATVVKFELRDLLGIDAEPVDYRVFRWINSYPQADVGHLERVADIENKLPANIYVTGASYRGLAVPDCIQQGQNTAALLTQQLSERVSTQ